MEAKTMQKQFKLAACFFLLTVLLRGLSVEACQKEHEDCSSGECCDGLVCVEVSSGVFECEPEECEEHVDHDCTVHTRECCEPLTCVCDVTDGTCKSCTDKLRDVCDPNDTDCCERRAECVDPDSDGTYHCQCRIEGCVDDCDCCVNAVCTDGTCVCNKTEDDPCDPSAPVAECCERECVAITGGDSKYACKTV